MFTGLVQKIGRLVSFEKNGDCGVITIGCEPWDQPLDQGESVCVNGVCLTVVAAGPESFVSNVLDETLAMTSVSTKRPGVSLNLERAILAGERFGGHFVTGHIDGMGKVVVVGRVGADRVIGIECDEDLAAGIVMKGSIACDGVSLTVSELSGRIFKVNIIPFTWENTALSGLKPGDMINVETDMLGKYVKRYIGGAGHGGGVSMEDLARAGFVVE